jgi:cell division protein ZapA
VRVARGPVKVEICGRSYTLRGIEPEAARHLAATVDRRMKAIAGDSATADTLKLAILAALNLADDLERLRREALYRTERARTRAEELVGRFDAMLATADEGTAR